jgi:Zn-dependent protease/predicted transcriptional regulator
MDANLKLGKILNIPFGVHSSWFLIFGLLTWSLATGYFPQEYPELSGGVHWLLGLVTSLLFFGSVLAHELGHAVTAIRNGIPVKGITLFIFGGVAQIAQEPKTPGMEFRIAIAGPLVSLALGLLFGAIWLLDQNISVLAAPNVYLARMNLILAVFNLIPGFPLDGGRVLRSVLWAVNRDYQKSTRIASFTGQLVAFGFMAVGVWTIFTGQFFNGLWLIFIGWFLQNAAASSYAQVAVQNVLRDARVDQVMNREVPQVNGYHSLERIVHEQVVQQNQRAFFVTGSGGQIVGLLPVKQIMTTPRERWSQLAAMDVMIPLQDTAWVQSEAGLISALQKMDEANVAQLPVFDGSRVAGLLSREQVLHYIRLRTEIGI